MNTPLLTNQNYGRMVAVHGNSCAEFRISMLLGAQHARKACFFYVQRLNVSMGCLRGANARRYLVHGILTRKRLTNFFRMEWFGLNVLGDSMNTRSVSEIQDLITDVQLAAYLVGEQLNALELVLEGTIGHRADAFSRAIMCQTSNLHCEFRGLEAHLNALNGLGAELRGEGC